MVPPVDLAMLTQFAKANLAYLLVIEKILIGTGVVTAQQFADLLEEVKPEVDLAWWEAVGTVQTARMKAGREGAGNAEEEKDPWGGFVPGKTTKH